MNELALLFDMDGVIVDNHAYHLKSWLSFFSKYGIDMSEAEYKAQVNGRTMSAILRNILDPDLADSEVQEIGEKKEALYREMYRPHIKPTPGLVSFLAEVIREQVPRTISTSAPPENVDFTLSHTGLRHYFPTIVDASMVSEGKPHPEVYLKSAQALNMPPENCVVFEDAILGIQAGKNAGMTVVGVATTHHREELLAEGTDLIIDNFADINLSTLKQLVRVGL